MGMAFTVGALMGRGETWGIFLVGRGTPLMTVGGATPTGKGTASV